MQGRDGVDRGLHGRVPAVELLLEPAAELLARDAQRVPRPAWLDRDDRHVAAALAVETRVRLRLADGPRRWTAAEEAHVRMVRRVRRD